MGDKELSSDSIRYAMDLRDKETVSPTERYTPYGFATRRRK